MILLIDGLAFVDSAARDAVKIGVLAGSCLSALAGYTLQRFAAVPSKS